MITLTWSWFSFIMGIAASFTLVFWALVAVAYNQYRKQKKKASEMDEALKAWVGKTPKDR